MNKHLRVKLDFHSFAQNGNAFALMSFWKRQATKQGFDSKSIDAVIESCMKCSCYDYLVSILLENSVEKY